jgi:hypothetical protein
VSSISFISYREEKEKRRNLGLRAWKQNNLIGDNKIVYPVRGYIHPAHRDVCFFVRVFFFFGEEKQTEQRPYRCLGSLSLSTASSQVFNLVFAGFSGSKGRHCPALFGSQARKSVPQQHRRLLVHRKNPWCFLPPKVMCPIQSASVAWQKKATEKGQYTPISKTPVAMGPLPTYHPTQEEKEKRKKPNKSIPPGHVMRQTSPSSTVGRANNEGSPRSQHPLTSARPANRVPGRALPTEDKSSSSRKKKPKQGKWRD